MEAPARRMDDVLANNVLYKLQHLVFRGARLPYTEEVTWERLPALLSERAFYLSGLPAGCQPVVNDDKVQDDPKSWPQEKLQMLEKSLNEGSVKVLFREPISRRVIFELVDSDGTTRDSTLGFSPRWCFDHLFAERTYGNITIEMLKTLNVQSLTAILSAADGLKIPSGQLPWISLPPKLWQAGYYITGIPRACVPVAVDDKIPSSAPSLGAKFRKDQRLLLQRAIDAGLVAILERPPGRQVIFEVLDTDGVLRDYDCGYSAEWKAQHSEKKPSRRRTRIQNPMFSNLPVPRPLYPAHVGLDVNTVVDYYKALLVPYGLLLETPMGPAWSCLPQMLATKRLIIFGLPRPCIPVVQNDIVVDNYDPSLWPVTAHVAFLKVAHRNQLYVTSRPLGQRILYRALEDNGVLTADTLGFSDNWCKEYLDPLDLSNPSIPPGVYVIGMWLDMLESVNIPCHDNLGRRHIQWAYLPMFLAHRGLCIAGCPNECIPRVDNDKVLEVSSPYFYDGVRIAAMHRAFSQRKVSIRPRAAGTDTLFCGVENGQPWQSTCGFSDNWIQKNIRSFPSAVINYVPVQQMTMQRPMVPLQIQTPVPVAPQPQDFTRLPTPADTPLREKRPQATSETPASLPKTIATITPESSATSRASVDSSDSVQSPTPVSKVKDEPEASLKIIIPPFKRRAIAIGAAAPAKKPLDALPPSDLPGASVFKTETDFEPPLTPTKASTSSAASASILATLTPSPTPPRIESSLSFQSSTGLVLIPTPIPPPVFTWGPIPQGQTIPTITNHLLTSKRPSVKVSYSSPRRRNTAKREIATPTPPEVSDLSDEEPEPLDTDTAIRTIGTRTSLSPPLPPSHALPNPLPEISPPSFLPKPGGNLRWDPERKGWELTVSEACPPSEWQKILPVYPSRVFWNPVLQIWTCEPSKGLSHPPKEDRIGLSPQVWEELRAATREGPLPTVEPGLCIIWHRWRRTWGLFQFDPHSGQRRP